MIDYSEVIRALLLLLYAGVCALSDLKYRRISLSLSLVMAILGVFTIIFEDGFLIKEDRDFSGLFYPFLPGVVLAVMSLLTKGAIGMGDAIFILILGLYLSVQEVVATLFMTWMLSAVAAVMIIALTKCKGKSAREKSMPFTTLAFPVILIVFGSRYV